MGKEVKPDRSTTVREKTVEHTKRRQLSKGTKDSFESVNIQTNSYVFDKHRRDTCQAILREDLAMNDWKTGV